MVCQSASFWFWDDKSLFLIIRDEQGRSLLMTANFLQGNGRKLVPRLR
jgi:hypothetical protein